MSSKLRRRKPRPKGELARMLIAKANESLSVARVYFELKRYDGAVPSVYYAVHAGMRAVLRTLGSNAMMPASVIRSFKSDVIERGLVARKFEPIIIRLLKRRDELEEGDFFTASRSEARTSIAEGVELVNVSDSLVARLLIKRMKNRGRIASD